MIYLVDDRHDRHSHVDLGQSAPLDFLGVPGVWTSGRSGLCVAYSGFPVVTCGVRTYPVSPGVPGFPGVQCLALGVRHRRAALVS